MEGEWRRSRRERLCRRGGFAGNIAGRNAAFFHREDGAAGVTIEDIEKPSLVALNHDGNVFSVVAQRGEQRRRGGIVIPQVVMDELESPDELSGFCAERDHGIRPLVIAGSQTAVIVWTGPSRGDADRIAVLV